MSHNLRLSAFATAALLAAPAFAMPAGHKMDNPAQEPKDAFMDHADHCGLPVGEGVVTAVDVAKSKVKISHQPIATIGWSAMTMEFGIVKPVDLAAFATGDKVHFLLAAQKDKSYRIAALCALDAEKSAHEACMKSMHEAAMTVSAETGKSCDMNMDGMDHENMPGMDHKDHSAIDVKPIVLASHPDETDEERCKDHEDHDGMTGDGHDHDGDGDSDGDDHGGHDCDDEGDDGDDGKKT